MDVKRYMARVGAVALLLLSSCTAAQHGPVGPSSDFARARRLVDRGIAVLEANPNASWDEVRPLLFEVMRSEPTPYLDDAESADLQKYLSERAARLRPILDRLNASAQRTPTAFTVQEECPVYCVVFFLLACESDCLVGACIGVFDCDAGATVPDCDECGEEAETPCSDDEDCPQGYRCAKWVFKENECVKTCEDDGDCPSGQECKRPFGTRYKRCK